MLPRIHRDGWSTATAAELAARQTAMTLVAAWYRSLDGGHVVFCANDSAPNLDYLRDAEAASGILPGPGAVTRASCSRTRALLLSRAILALSPRRRECAKLPGCRYPDGAARRGQGAGTRARPHPR